MSNERVSKLADIKGPRAIEAFAELIEPATSIAADPEAVDFFTGAVKSGRLERVGKMVKLWAKHKDDFVAIEAIKRGIPQDQLVANMGMDDIMASGTELMNDPLFLSFFVLARRDETTSG